MTVSLFQNETGHKRKTLHDKIQTTILMLMIHKVYHTCQLNVKYISTEYVLLKCNCPDDDCEKFAEFNKSLFHTKVSFSSVCAAVSQKMLILELESTGIE